MGIDIGSKTGVVVASSAMGLSIFDLFNEVINTEDMKLFLTQHQVLGDFSGPALIIRCFLQMIELSHKQVHKTEENIETIQDHAIQGPVSQDQVNNGKLAETISKLSNTIPVAERSMNITDINKQAVILPPKQNEIKHDNVASTAIITDQLVVQQQLKCRITVNCSLQFDTIAKRDEHERTFQHFTCEHCNIGFWTWAEWQRHRNEDPNCKALNCPICDKSFRHIKQGYKKSKLKEHILNCENLQNFICDVCGKGFNIERSLIKHREIHTEKANEKRLIHQLNNLARSEGIKRKIFLEQRPGVSTEHDNRLVGSVENLKTS